MKQLLGHRARQDATLILRPTSRDLTIREREQKEKKQIAGVFGRLLSADAARRSSPSLRANAWHRACFPPATRCAPTSAENGPREQFGAPTSASLWSIYCVCWPFVVRYFSLLELAWPNGEEEGQAQLIRQFACASNGHSVRLVPDASHASATTTPKPQAL